jgi:hypothetical protein
MTAYFCEAQQLQAMGTACLASTKYKTGFYSQTEQWSQNYQYRNKDGSVFMTNMVSEITSESAGMQISAKGNFFIPVASTEVHFPITMSAHTKSQQKKYITDKMKVKNIIILGPPHNACALTSHPLTHN